MEAARQCAECCGSLVPERSYALIAYRLESGGMPLHNAVGVNCKTY